MPDKKWTPELAMIEHDRLDGSVPWGVCCQVPLETLRALKTPTDGAAFYQRWRQTDVVESNVPAVADVMLVMDELGVDQDRAVIALGGIP